MSLQDDAVVVILELSSAIYFTTTLGLVVFYTPTSHILRNYMITDSYTIWEMHLPSRAVSSLVYKPVEVSCPHLVQVQKYLQRWSG